MSPGDAQGLALAAFATVLLLLVVVLGLSALYGRDEHHDAGLDIVDGDQ